MTTFDPPAGSLDGLKILDLSRILAGPTATQLLGDLGAEIIKIERPGSGDDTRGWGPPFLKDADGRETEESAYYLCANRNKKSVAVDISKPDGQAVVKALAAKCDVVIENFKAGDLKRYGLDYDSLASVHPRLVYCSITGFGQTGPLAGRPGYDFMIQGMGGIMSLTGFADAEGGRPTKVGVGIADVMCGMYAACGILAALQARQRTGRGQHIDLALFDTQVAWLINQGAAYLISGEVPTRRGNDHPTIVPYGTFPASDCDFIVAVGNDAQFARFCHCLGRPDIAEDARFSKNADRVRNRQALIGMLRPLTAARPAAEWLALMEKHAIPGGPINALGAVLDHPQTRARAMRIDMPHPNAAGGTVPLIGNPLKLSQTPVSYRQAPPLLGEHTRAVLRTLLGMQDEEIDDLEKKATVATGRMTGGYA